MSLDDSQVYAHTVDAKIKLYFDRDWAGAEQAISRALSVDPADSELHHTYSHVLLAMRRFPESLAESRRAIELDPLYVEALAHLPFHYYMTRDFEAGIAAAQRALEVDPRHFPALSHLVKNYEVSGRLEQAAATLPKLGFPPSLMESLRDARKASPQESYWRILLTHHLKARGAEHAIVDDYELTKSYSRLNDRDHAFEWLHRAYEDRSSWLVYLKVDPAFDNLRADPRFTELVRRVGLP